VPNLPLLINFHRVSAPAIRRRQALPLEAAHRPLRLRSTSVSSASHFPQFPRRQSLGTSPTVASAGCTRSQGDARGCRSAASSHLAALPRRPDQEPGPRRLRPAELSPTQFLANDTFRTADACGPRSSPTPRRLSRRAGDRHTAAVKAKTPARRHIPSRTRAAGPDDAPRIKARTKRSSTSTPRTGGAALLFLFPRLDLAKDGPRPLVESGRRAFGAGRPRQAARRLSARSRAGAPPVFVGQLGISGKPLRRRWYVDGVTIKYKPIGHADRS